MRTVTSDQPLSLTRLLNQTVLANPYPLYEQLRTNHPVHWDPILRVWVVSRYQDVIHILQHFSSKTSPSPEQLSALGLDELAPIAQLMQQQMPFMDAPQHSRIRALAAQAFSPRHIEQLRDRVEYVVNSLLDTALAKDGAIDIMSALAQPLPAIVTAEMLGVSLNDVPLLTRWSLDYASVMGNFQLDPDHSANVLRSVEEMLEYFQQQLHDQRQHPRQGLISALIEAEIDGGHLTDDEIMSNVIIVMMGGLETTTNLIGNGILALLHYPEQLELLRHQPDLLLTAIEEMLRFESPSQFAARVATAPTEINGVTIYPHQTVFVLLGAANRDPEKFAHPDIFDIQRTDNRHVAFAWGSHFCFGSYLARMEGQIVFETLLRRLPRISLLHQNLTWRENLGLRGLTHLWVTNE